MNNTFYVIKSPDDIQHYGVLGMKWGVRRYQNADGSLTARGQKHYGSGNIKRIKKELNKRIKMEKNKRFTFLDIHNKTIKGIGKYSDQVNAQIYKDRKKIEAEKGYKDFDSEWHKLNRDNLSGKITQDEYNKKIRKLITDFYTKSDVGKRYMETLKIKPRYGDDLGKFKLNADKNDAFIEKYGDDLNKAYLKDLGFDENGIKYISDYLKKNKVVIGINGDYM